MERAAEPPLTAATVAAVIDALPDVALVEDAGGRVTACSRVAVEQLGLARERLVGARVAELLISAEDDAVSGAPEWSARVAEPRGSLWRVRVRARPLGDGRLLLIHEETGLSRERLALLAEAPAALARAANEDAIAAVIVERARRLTGAEYAALFLRAEGTQPPLFVPKAVSGAPRESFPDIANVDPEQLRFEGVFRPLFAEGVPQYVRDVAAEAERHGFPDVHPRIGSYVAYPLLRLSGEVDGALLVGHTTRNAFDEEDLELVRLLSGQVAAALHSSRLYLEMQRALRDSETLRFIGQQLAGQIDTDTLLQQLVRHARVILDADVAAVATLRADGRTSWVSTVGFEEPPDPKFTFGPGVGASGRVVAARAPLVFDVANSRDDFPVLSREQVVTAFGVPLLRGMEAFGGLIAGYRRPAPVSGHEIALAQALASHASVALENARLIDQEKQRTSEVEVERRLLSTVLDNLPVGVMIVEPDARLSRVNPLAAQITGTAATAMVGHELDAVLALRRGDGSSFPQHELPHVRALTAGEVVTSVQATVETEDGTALPVLVNAGPVPGDDGMPAAAVLALQDVRHLIEVQRLKDEFLSLASHELKTPLTPLIGLTQLLLRALDRGRTPQPEQLRSHLRTIERQAQHMAGLVSDLLDVSRIQQGRMKIEFDRVNLAALARDVVERFGQIDPSDAARRLVLDLPAEPVEVAGDRMRLDQVLTNLISNALKYSPDGGEVRVGVRSLGGQVEAWVQDQGIGIPAAEQDGLFEPFHRASNAAERHIGGVGLGLHITAEIVRRHDGRIAVQSEAGQGARFTVVLPQSDVPGDAQQGGGATAASG